MLFEIGPTFAMFIDTFDPPVKFSCSLVIARELVAVAGQVEITKWNQLATVSWCL